MEQAGWLCRRERRALPAILTAAENARIAEAWAVLMRPGIPQPPHPNDE